MEHENPTAAFIAAALGGKKRGKNWSMRCPAHDDKAPSLDVMDAADGTVLVICRAGCTQEAVLTALRDKHGIKLFSGDAPAKPTEAVPGVRSVSVSELLRRPPLSWLVKGAIPSQGVGTFIGPPGCGKTFMALHLTACFLRGAPWMGHKIKESGGVACVQAEGIAGFSNRVRAYMQAFPEINWPMLRIIDQPISFTDPQQLDSLIARINTDSELWAPIRLLIVDTVNATMGGVDENTSDGMGSYKAAALRIAAECRLFVLLIHHTGKDPTRGGRGHSSLFGAVDAEFVIAPELREDPHDESRYPRMVPTGRRYIKGTKMRDGELMDEQFFELQQVSLGKDADGDPVTSCIVKPTGWAG